MDQKRSAPAVTAAQRGRPHIDPALSMLMRTLFYRTSWSKLLNSSVGVSIALIISLSLNVMQYMYRPKPVYFGITSDGRLVPIVPMDQPMATSDDILQFVEKSMRNSFSLDFDENNLRAKLQAIRPDYTKDGYTALLNAMDASGLVDKIRKQRLVSSAVATGAPVLHDEYVGKDGAYTWEAEMPISLTLSGQNERKSYDYLLHITVKRIPTVDNPRGYATDSIQFGNNQKIN